MRRRRYLTTWLVGILALSALLIVACGGAAEPEPAAQAEPAAPAAGQPTATPVPDATATPAPTATPLPEGVETAQDSIVLVVPEEPVNLNSFLSIGGSLYASITRANLQDPLTWQSGDDLRIVPTTVSTGWEQIDADTWRFNLREGVTFHNGEAFNADAALPSLTANGSPTSEGGSINYTGPHTSVKVDDYTVDITCQDACPIFPNTAFFLGFEAPEWLASTTEEERAGESIGLGPTSMSAGPPASTSPRKPTRATCPWATTSSSRSPRSRTSNGSGAASPPSSPPWLRPKRRTWAGTWALSRLRPSPQTS